MNPVICSWDVGCRHLAYCVMKKRDNKKNKYKIYDWKIIDIIGDEDKFCCVCKKPAKFMQKDNGKKWKYCCTKHKKDLLGDVKILQLKNKKKHQCQFESKKRCKKYATVKFNDVNYCTAHGKTAKKNHDKLKKYKKLSAAKYPIELVKIKLFKILDTMDFGNVDEIVIENQPSMKNPRMKAIATSLFDYFLMRYVIDYAKDKRDKKINIYFYSPSNKLRLNEDNTVEVLSRADQEHKKYKLTKELSIKYCYQMIGKNEKYVGMLEKYKKKDDMCDAFLQGVSFDTVGRSKRKVKINSE